MLKFMLFLALCLVVQGQDFDRCGPPRPVIPPGPGIDVPNPCPDCPVPCPNGQVCCALGICGRACFDPFCPPGLGTVNCFAPPCLTARCPRFPNARCTNDFCGGCNAIFTNPSTLQVIPEFACELGNNWPECLATILCPRPPFSCQDGCPRVPGAECNLNCDCQQQFTDRITGKILSAEECGREFDDRCPPIPLAPSGSICGVCPRGCPNGQICCPTACFGGPSGSACIDIPRVTCPSLSRVGFRFDCTDGFNEGSECRLFCNSDQFLIGTRSIRCEADGEWSVDPNRITCIREEDFDPRCPEVQPIRPANCPVCPTNCRGGEICCPNGCPGSSNCIAVPTSPTCPPNRPPVNCFDSPCRTATCPRFPNAVCTDDFCGGCNAIFTDPDNGRVIPKFACELTSRWPQCTFIIRCGFFPGGINCENGCPGQPEAVCNLNCDCSRIFTDERTGDVFTRRQCGRFSPSCPALPPGPCQGIEPACVEPCPRPLVCCPVGCGSQCIDLRPPTTTPRPTTASPTCQKKAIRFMTYRCGIHPRFRTYTCFLRCRSGYRLDGPSQVRCVNGRFTPSLDEIKCDKRSSSSSSGGYRSCRTCGK